MDNIGIASPAESDSDPPPLSHDPEGPPMPVNDSIKQQLVCVHRPYRLKKRRPEKDARNIWNICTRIMFDKKRDLCVYTYKPHAIVLCSLPDITHTHTHREQVQSCYGPFGYSIGEYTNASIDTHTHTHTQTHTHNRND
eukprot:GHVR01023265.1.p1 GENE.GHVR01023265.1~~GHVR01023265.1.p1  ORF type:complete len:139 (-),score=73.69 GHVR01023265.1:170-586(-)